MKLSKYHIQAALAAAIDMQSKIEKEAGYTSDSIMVAAWKEQLEAIQKATRNCERMDVE